MKQFFVYVMASYRRVLYIGVTSDLQKRVHEHREGLVDGFTKRYWVKLLVYWEEAPDAVSAIEREKQLKRWRRDKKLKLIESMNSEWRDLAGDIGLE